MATWLLPGKSRSQSSAAQSHSYGKGAKAMQTIDVTEKEKKRETVVARRQIQFAPRKVTIYIQFLYQCFKI